MDEDRIEQLILDINSDQSLEGCIEFDDVQDRMGENILALQGIYNASDQRDRDFIKEIASDNDTDLSCLIEINPD